MTMPSSPAARPPEGRDTSMGNSVDAGEAARETAQIAAQMDQAERYAEESALAGYAGNGPIPDRGMFTLTGSDDA